MACGGHCRAATQSCPHRLSWPVVVARVLPPRACQAGWGRSVACEGFTGVWGIDVVCCHRSLGWATWWAHGTEARAADPLAGGP